MCVCVCRWMCVYTTSPRLCMSLVTSAFCYCILLQAPLLSGMMSGTLPVNPKMGPLEYVIITVATQGPYGRASPAVAFISNR